MPARLPIPSSVQLSPEETDLRKIVDAGNFVAQQAFAPYSEIAVGTNAAQSITGPALTVITGVSIELTVPVPSRVRIHAKVAAECTTYAITENLSVAMYRDGVVIPGTYCVQTVSAVNDTINLGWSFMQTDLIPEVLYTYDLRASVTTIFPGAVYSIDGTNSNLIITTEGRQRV